MNRADDLLARIRELPLTPAEFRRTFDALDAHLSAGGAPPEAWREGPDAPGADSGYGFTGWEEEADLGNDDDREGVHYLTITDPDGEEYAVIVHRVCDGRYPLDGPGAQSKVRRAEHIVAALNRDVR